MKILTDVTLTDDDIYHLIIDQMTDYEIKILINRLCGNMFSNEIENVITDLVDTYLDGE